VGAGTRAPAAFARRCRAEPAPPLVPCALAGRLYRARCRPSGSAWSST